MATDSSLEWQQRFAHVLDELDGPTRRKVAASIQSNVIEGFDPVEADVSYFVDVALGRTSVEEYIATVTKTV